MKNNFLVCLIIPVLILSGCQTGGINTLTAPPNLPESTVAATIAAVEVTPDVTSTLEPTAMPTLVFTASAPATCVVAPVVPALPAEIDGLVPSVSSTDWSYGPETASITFYEYSDFQCPFCAKLAPVLKELQAKYPQDIRVIYRHLPLISIHDKAALAAQAAEAAGLQKKFWQMHDLLFSKQSEWAALSVEGFKTWLYGQAVSLKLDPAQFTTDLTKDSIVLKVNTAETTARNMGLSSTPFLFINKFPYQNRYDLETLTGVTRYFLLSGSAFTSCPPMTIDSDKQYTATIKTEKGEIVLSLFPKQAPMAANNFVFLAKQKWFDNSAFFRVIPRFLVQAGDPTGSGLANPGYRFTNEVTPELRFNKPGVLGMANSGDGTNGSQFFITYAAAPEFDGKYTIFGQVISGMDVLESLRPRNPEKDPLLLPADKLLSITIEEK
ncbi:MAG: ppiB [Chloroflexi bacterium]|nr:MAG: ppiB [Chloroflexota bacterium]